MHIGVNAGAGFPVASGGRLEGFGADAFGLAAPSRDRAGASFGAQIGYDWRKGDMVYGVETDLNYLGARRAATGLFAAVAIRLGLAGYALTADENEQYFMSLRGRLGAPSAPGSSMGPAASPPAAGAGPPIWCGCRRSRSIRRPSRNHRA